MAFNLQEILARKAAKEQAELGASRSEQVAYQPSSEPPSAPAIEPIKDAFILNTKETKIEEIAKTQASSSYAEAVQASIQAGLAKRAEQAHSLSLADKLEALKSAAKTEPSVPVHVPHAKMSLAEKLALKKHSVEQAELSQDAPTSVPSSVAQEDPAAIFIDHQEKPKAKLTQEIIDASNVHVPTGTKEKPAQVIEIDGKFFTLEELAYQIARLEKQALAIKSPIFEKKIAKLKEKQTELETLIDLELEAMAPQVGKLSIALTPTEIAELDGEPADLTNGAAIEEVQALMAEAVADTGVYQGAFSLNIHLNERQLMAKEFALAGKSYCLIGPAGSGKTTAQRSVAEALLESDRLHTCSYKVQGGEGARVEGPSFVAVAYTRRASANLARAIHKNPRLESVLKHNIMTVHALLEFEPVYFYDDEKQRESMRFEPKRDACNPLNITHLAIEEASMLGLDLWLQLYDALPQGVQIIFIGDINQLPPVFGASILNYALVQLPVIELTEVYRNGGIILDNAHRILKGQELIEGESIDPDNGKVSKFTIVRGKSEQQVGQEKMAQALGMMFKLWYDSGEYQPDEDMILSPFNVQALGTDNMNKWIAQFLGEKRKAIVYEVLAGFNKHYLAVGDRVMVNKQDGYITKITNNAQYQGQEPQLPGSDLSRFGMRIIGAGSNQDMDEMDDILLGYTNFNLEELAEQNLERKQQASHLVDVLLESGQIITLNAAGEFGPQVFSLGYVLTVHKAQGCEFRKVFIIMHKDHSVMLCRELFYTAETRAREECVVIAKDWIIAKAIKAQKIKGDTLQDKIEYFNSGAVDLTGGITCLK